jgi:hypothetical protein
VAAHGVDTCVYFLLLSNRDSRHKPGNANHERKSENRLFHTKLLWIDVKQQSVIRLMLE